MMYCCRKERERAKNEEREIAAKQEDFDPNSAEGRENTGGGEGGRRGSGTGRGNKDFFGGGVVYGVDGSVLFDLADFDPELDPLSGREFTRSSSGETGDLGEEDLDLEDDSEASGIETEEEETPKGKGRRLGER